MRRFTLTIRYRLPVFRTFDDACACLSAYLM